MDKSLLLGLPMLLCCFRVLSGSFLGKDHSEIVQCRMCHLQFPGEKCSKGRGLCMATTEEACTTGKIFKKDGTPWLTFMGCLEHCANVDDMKWGPYLVKFRCCRSKDLCNELL
uniref:Prostate and testis expressed 1 n=1 Tax=Molossus molossus TaxID=27622 RepID=A0A7J8BZ29_MOLMO|nr:prostate and testis expressed 1 [Molossus molossus]